MYRSIKIIILFQIGDNQSLLQSIKNSAEYESFADRANNWENKLCDLDYYLMSLSQVQKKYSILCLYLYFNFSNNDPF